MNLRTLTASGLLLGGAGLFCLSQNQANGVGITSHSRNIIPVVQSSVLGLAAPAPGAPTVVGVYAKIGNDELRLGSQTHLTALIFRVTLAGDSAKRPGKVEVVADGTEVIRTLETKTDEKPQNRDLDIDLTRFADKGQKTLQARFRANDGTVSELSSQEAKLAVVTRGTPPEVVGFLVGDKKEPIDSGLVRSNGTELIKMRVNFSEAGPKEKGGRLVVEVNGSVVDEKTFSEKDIADLKDAIEKKTAVHEFHLVPQIVSQFENRGTVSVLAKWESANSTNKPLPVPSVKKLALLIDTQGPQVEDVRLVGEPGAPNELAIRFHEDDLDEQSATSTSNYTLRPLSGNGNAVTLEKNSIRVSGREVRIAVGSLLPGYYELTVHGATKEKSVMDLAKNLAGGKAGTGKDLKFPFSALPEPDVRTGKHVPFEEYTKRPPRKENEVFNPGDKVETRVARLYYFRDAHRVAQIVNRNVQSYNRAAVKMNERLAEDARNEANAKTDERRTKERAAIRAAETTREEERKLNDLRTALEQSRAAYAQSFAQERELEAEVKDYEIKKAPADEAELNKLSGQIAQTNGEIEKLEIEISSKTKELEGIPESDTEKRGSLKKEIDSLNATLAQKKATLNELTAKKQAIVKKRESFKDREKKIDSAKATAQQVVRDLASKVAQQEQNVATKRNAEKDAQEHSTVAEATEDRARENQWRAEVAAATTDPDTYVPGEPDSHDPVTQVSISVIGEGVLQLRGPIRGINKIRTMINQIDSPLGQVKVGIFTVQVNGEHGDRMEKVATRVEGHIDISRFLTNQSLGYLRRAIQEVSGMIVANVDAQFPGQHRQIDRDRKYLYAFFGRDFIDELYEMDSEFLRTENKLLSLHGMDTISQSQACFILALAKNDVRQQILDQFRYLITCELPQAEWDYRRASRLLPCKLNSIKEVYRNANDKYTFRNVHGFFEAWVGHPEAMTPMQREFIRLAQIFKSQLVAEMELKQRVIERGLIEDAANDESAIAKDRDHLHGQSLELEKEAYRSWMSMASNAHEVSLELSKVQNQINADLNKINNADRLLNKIRRIDYKLLIDSTNKQASIRKLHSVHQAAFSGDDGASERNTKEKGLSEISDKPANDAQDKVDIAPRELPKNDRVFPTDERHADAVVRQLKEVVESARSSKILRPSTKEFIDQKWKDFLDACRMKAPPEQFWRTVDILIIDSMDMVREDAQMAIEVAETLEELVSVIENPQTRFDIVSRKYNTLWSMLTNKYRQDPEYVGEIKDKVKIAYDGLKSSELRIRNARFISNRVRRDIDHRKLLEFQIDEQEEKYIELVEGTRSHIAQIDNYLKRLAIALEDDFKVQFYDPAFKGVREASREWDVNLGQVERTTILTNNRQLAKVSPQATMEFDLPKRAPMIVEGMNGARALVQEYGTLLQDPTFLSLAGMMSGTPAVGGAASAVVGGPAAGLRSAAVRPVLPGLSTDASEQLMAQSGGPDRKFGTALEGLIPDPAVYKFETGTGFEIRPVIQPDGHSVIYDFDYMYTTNVREPVRPDEKHLGRVKRHFIHTQVQTSSFELREISRYQVALKASRTSRGVPLLEDIPGAGVLFRPLPSDESSLQQNIILAQSTVYPTLFDLMGLRWSKYVADLDHLSLRDLEHTVRGREQAIHDFTFDEASKRVDEFLDIQGKQPDHLRRDFYHQQRRQSPYHPGGYFHQPSQDEEAITDPHNRNFTVPDRRPEEYRSPAYDPLRRNPVDNELRQIPTQGGHPEDVDLRLQPPEDVPPPAGQRQPFEDVPPAPTGAGPAARKGTTSANGGIQPASFEQAGIRPGLSAPAANDKVQPAAVPNSAKPSAPAAKRSWFKKSSPKPGQ